MSDAKTRKFERSDDEADLQRLRHQRCRQGECCAHAGETVPVRAVLRACMEVEDIAREQNRILSARGMRIDMLTRAATAGEAAGALQAALRIRIALGLRRPE